MVCAPAYADVQIIDDPSNRLTDKQRSDLQGILFKNYEATKVQIVIWLPSLDKDDVLATAANDYFRKKGIGEKNVDNGLLVVVDIPNRRTRIEVGYGLEGVFTDSRMIQVVDSMSPFFRQGDLFGGLKTAIETLSKYSSEWTSDKTAPSPSTATYFWSIVAMMAILFMVMVIGLLLYARQRKLEYLRKKAREDVDYRASLAAAVPNPRHSYPGRSAGTYVRSEPAPSYVPKRRDDDGGSVVASVVSAVIDSVSRSSDGGSSYSSDGGSSYSSDGGSSGGGGSESSW